MLEIGEARDKNLFDNIMVMKFRLEIGRRLLKSSLGRDSCLSRGWTIACLNEDGTNWLRWKKKLHEINDSRVKLIETESQKKLGIESSSHYLFCEEKMRLWISVEVDGMKLVKFGGGVIGHWDRSEESDGWNKFRKYAFNLLIKKS